MIKRIDKLGRVVIPKGYRQALGIEPGDPVFMEEKGGVLILSSSGDRCVFCGLGNGVKVLHSKGVCTDCLKALAGLSQGTEPDEGQPGG